MLSDWLPFLIYAFFAAVIPATMIMGSFLFATRPTSRTKQRMIPFESGVSDGPPAQDRRFTVSFYLTAMLSFSSTSRSCFSIRSRSSSTRLAGSG